MKSFIGILALTSSMSAMALEGYDDINLDKKKDLIVHSIMCSKDLKDLNQLKPVVIFTNTPTIERGTYYFKSAFGDYSASFSPTQNDSIKKLDLLQNGKTLKKDVETRFCIVDVKGLESELPRALTFRIKQDTVKADDKNWESLMKNYEFSAGKPVFGKTGG